jgi:hypothetical protein
LSAVGGGGGKVMCTLGWGVTIVCRGVGTVYLEEGGHLVCRGGGVLCRPHVGGDTVSSARGGGGERGTIQPQRMTPQVTY